MRNKLIILFISISSICFGQNNPQIKIFETNCDSIYKTKDYKIIQQYFPDGIDTIFKNTIFQLLSSTEIIFQDTIYSSSGEIEFKDFNNDGIKDILAQNTSDVRSNWTYYLYLIDTTNNQIKKVKGFEEIKNPHYLPQYDIIDNYVNSGKEWTSFYKIKNDSIIDYGIVIYDNHTDNGTYEFDYKNAIQTILNKDKTSR